MANFHERSDVAPPRRMQRSGIVAVFSVCSFLAASLLSPPSAFAGVQQKEVEERVPDAKALPYADFLAKYVEWARTIEAEGQKRGTPLAPEQMELADQIGIEHPEKVRLVFVDAVPFPADDEAMRKIGESLGFIGPDVTNNAQAFGYTVWIRKGFTLDRPGLAHELVHVAQIERIASFDAYVERYMLELLEHGHADMPLEVEAYEANQRYR